MIDTFHGSAYPCAGPEDARRDPHTLLPYRGCGPAARRYGTARTAPTWVRRAAGHQHTAPGDRRANRIHAALPQLPGYTPAIRLDLGEHPWSGIPCWSGRAERWVHFTVPTAYRLRYDSDVRPVMPGNPIALKTLLRVAAARAEFADHRTGRNCRASNATLAAVAGVSVRTVQRASTVLRLLGVATEVLRGRQRSRHERYASWRVGDRGRGWASVWVLHDSRSQRLSPHPEGSFSLTKTSVKSLVTTAPRRAGGRKTRPDERATILAQRWVTDPDSPPWARRYRTATVWARLLTGPAQHGWIPRDINELIRDYIRLGNWVPDSPHKPAGLLGRILAWHGNFEERPAALTIAFEAEQLAADRARIAQQRRDHEAHQRARAVGRDALHGAGHAAARQALKDAMARAQRRRELAERREREREAEQ